MKKNKSFLSSCTNDNVGFNSKFSTFLPLSLFSLTLLSGGVLTSLSVSADVVDQINVLVPVSCSLLSNGNTSNTYNVTIANGVYEQPIGQTVLKAICNDNNGYSIYASGFTGNEVGATNSNRLVGPNNTYIVTGTATSGATSNWAMKLTATAGTYAPIIAGSASDTEKQTGDPDFSSYTNVPNDFVRVAYRNSNTDSGNNAVGSTLTASYAVYISPIQTTGSYSGQVLYSLVHPASHAAPVICNPNAEDIDDVICMQDFINNAEDIIASMTPETQYTLTDKRDGKTYTIAKFATSPEEEESGGGQEQLNKSATKSGETKYTVWMTQNLDLDIDSNTTYTNEDTDIGYNTTTGQYDTAAWMPTRSTYTTTSGHIHEWCAGGTWNSEYSYCEENDTPESYDPGNLYWNLTQSDYTDWDTYYDSCNCSTSTPSCDQSLNPISTYASSTGTQQYHLGNYYNWAAAMAMNDSSEAGCSSGGSGSDEKGVNCYDLVEQSICPAGWTLPRVGEGEDSFYALWNEYGLYDGGGSSPKSATKSTTVSNVWSSPLYFTASGYYGGALGYVGYDGGFWSPIPDGSRNARNASFNVDGSLSGSDYYNRYYGQSVRCVARPVSSSYSGEKCPVDPSN